MIQIHFGEQTQILTVHLFVQYHNEARRTGFLRPSTSNTESFPSRYISSPGGCLTGHFNYRQQDHRNKCIYAMSPTDPFTRHIFQTELANPQHTLSRVFFRIRACIMGFHAIISEINCSDFERCFSNWRSARIRRRF